MLDWKPQGPEDEIKFDGSVYWALRTAEADEAFAEIRAAIGFPEARERRSGEATETPKPRRRTMSVEEAADALMRMCGISPR
jgi:hypothetical protein